MKQGELGLAVAFWTKNQSAASNVAVAVKKSNKVVAGKSAFRDATYDSGTAIVNALQHCGVLNKGSIYSTVAPTEMDLGMAKMRSVRAIYYPAAGAVQRLTVNSGTLLGNATPARDLNWTVPGGRTRLPTPTGGWLRGGDPAAAALAYRRSLATGGTAWASFSCAGEDQQIFDVLKSAAPIANGRLDPAAEFDKGRDRSTPVTGMTARVWETADTLFMLGAYALIEHFFLEKNTTSRGALEGGHNIGSILVKDDATVVGWGINTMSSHGTQHGEVNLIQAWQKNNAGGALPQDARLYSTLQPCHMCSAMIATAGANKGIKVFYGQDDPIITSSALARSLNGCTEEYLYATPTVAPTSQEEFRTIFPELADTSFETELLGGELEQLSVPFYLQNRAQYHQEPGVVHKKYTSTTGMLTHPTTNTILGNAKKSLLATIPQMNAVHQDPILTDDPGARWATINGRSYYFDDVVRIRKVFANLWSSLRDIGVTVS